MLRGSRAGASGPALLGRTVPREVRAFPLEPQLGWSQRRSFLKKTLVMATASANSDRLQSARPPARPLSPAAREEKGRSASGEGGGAWRGASRAPPLRWPGREPRCFLVRLKGDRGRGRGGILPPGRVLSAPGLSLVERKVGAGGGGAWRWVAVLSRCWAEGKKEACAGGWLPAAPRGPSTSYSLRHRNQKPEVSAETCTISSHPLPPSE